MAGPLSVRGRILPPDLDDRRWKDLVDEARSLIPKYAPQWTDHNSSDIGITLIELFAHMVEGLAYRLNRVPEKNYIAFLNLLGIKRDPATPSRAFLTFKTPPGPPVVVAKGKQAQTQGTETEAPVFFETDQALTVLPINMPLALLVRKSVLEKYSNISSSFTLPPAEGETLTIPALDSVQICLGFDLPTTLELRLLVRVFKPVKVVPGIGPQATVEWLYSTAGQNPTNWIAVPTLDDGTDGLTRDGVVRISLPLGWNPQPPPSWPVPANSAADTVSDPFHWIGLRIANTTSSPLKIGIGHILFNSVSAHNALTIPQPEGLGTSNGAEFQVFPLARAPAFKRLETDTPYDHLGVDVGGSLWSPVEDFPAGAGDFYRLDPVANEISFGNFDPATGDGHGTVPPTGTAITATTYRYVAGGTSGNVGAATITSLRTPVPGIIAVTNLFSAYGGSDEEAIEETKRRAPEALRNRHRAVTAEDYEYLAREATTDVKIVRCLEPRIHLVDDPNGAWVAGESWSFAGLVRDPGNVFVVVVPDHGVTDPRPEPSIDLLHEVQRFLDRRRDVTARLQVTGPRYLPVKVNVELHVWKQAIDGGLTTAPAVQVMVEDAIAAFLHPIHGGIGGRGWQVGQHVYAPDIFKAVNPPEELGYLARLDIEPQGPYPPYHDPPLGPGTAWLAEHRPFTLPIGIPSAFLRLADYELACFGSSVVTTSEES